MNCLKTENKINLVTGLWPGRNDRSEENYLNHLLHILKLSQPLTIYIPEKYREWVQNHRKEKIDIHIVELEDIQKKWFPYWNEVQKIRMDPEWLIGANWLSGTPQYFSQWYNPIVMSKPMFLAHSYKMDKWKSNKWIWIDAGITQHIPKEWITEISIDKFATQIKKILFIGWEYYANDSHGFKYEGYKKWTDKIPNWCCRGTIFGVQKTNVDEFWFDYNNMLSNTLNSGWMGTEESIFTGLTLCKPQTYEVHIQKGEPTGMPINYMKNLSKNESI